MNLANRITLALLFCLASPAVMGCELISSVDRSQIPGREKEEAGSGGGGQGGQGGAGQGGAGGAGGAGQGGAGGQGGAAAVCGDGE